MVGISALTAEVLQDNCSAKARQFARQALQNICEDDAEKLVYEVAQMSINQFSNFFYNCIEDTNGTHLAYKAILRGRSDPCLAAAPTVNWLNANTVAKVLSQGRKYGFPSEEIGPLLADFLSAYDNRKHGINVFMKFDDLIDYVVGNRDLDNAVIKHMEQADEDLSQLMNKDRMLHTILKSQLWGSLSSFSNLLTKEGYSDYHQVIGQDLVSFGAVSANPAEVIARIPGEVLATNVLAHIQAGGEPKHIVPFIEHLMTNNEGQYNSLFRNAILASPQIIRYAAVNYFGSSDPWEVNGLAAEILANPELLKLMPSEAPSIQLTVALAQDGKALRLVEALVESPTGQAILKQTYDRIERRFDEDGDPIDKEPFPTSIADKLDMLIRLDDQMSLTDRLLIAVRRITPEKLHEFAPGLSKDAGLIITKGCSIEQRRDFLRLYKSHSLHQAASGFSL